jgi:hypothetical protein
LGRACHKKHKVLRALASFSGPFIQGGTGAALSPLESSPRAAANRGTLIASTPFLGARGSLFDSDILTCILGLGFLSVAFAEISSLPLAWSSSAISQ